MKQLVVQKKPTPSGGIFLPRTKPSQLGIFFKTPINSTVGEKLDKSALKDLVWGLPYFHPATSGFFSSL